VKSDSQLQQDVLAELKWEPCVTASTIGVEVLSGIVTLAGQVGSYSEKWHAERAAQRVSGVEALAVEPATSSGSIRSRPRQTACETFLA